MAMQIALPMYDLPELRWATDAFGQGLLATLAQEGFGELPLSLARADDYKGLWVAPDLLFGQTCGYPLVTQLEGRVRYVATPCYDTAVCEGPLYCSVLVVRRDEPATSLAELRGRRVAFNTPYSQSGYNALRHAVAPLARDGHFFSQALQTGGHLASLAAVVAGEADVTALDGVTYVLLERYRPEAVASVRVLGRTAAAPGLPFITRGAATDEEVERLRRALFAALADPGLADARSALLLAGAEVLPPDGYAPLLAMEREAERCGYPAIA